MSCNNPIIIEEKIVCAVTCATKFNQNPNAKFRFLNFVLYDDSEYFDTSNESNRQIRWLLYVGDTLIYDFGFGNYFDEIPEFSNGSTYNEFNMGIYNTDMLAFLQSLPNTIVSSDITLTLLMDVKDSTGIQNTNLSNKYNFTY